MSLNALILKRLYSGYTTNQSQNLKNTSDSSFFHHSMLAVTTWNPVTALKR
jgi:hypothetical protein